MIKKQILIIFLCFSCKNDNDPSLNLIKVDNRKCIDACLHEQFKMFHSQTNQLFGGAASSSMSGISDSDVIKKLTDKCTDIFDECYECRNIHYCCDSLDKYWSYYIETPISRIKLGKRREVLK
jgi:hypothetical protein